MGRPSLGDQALTTTVGVRFSPAEMDQIRALGTPATVVRWLALKSLVSASENTPDMPDLGVKASEYPNERVLASGNPPSTPIPASEKHRHKRQRTGDHWVGGTNVGTWICSECREAIDP